MKLTKDWVLINRFEILHDKTSNFPNPFKYTIFFNFCRNKHRKIKKEVMILFRSAQFY